MTSPPLPGKSGLSMPLATPTGVSVRSLGAMSQGDRWRTEAMRSYSAPVLIWITRGQGRLTMAGQRRGYRPFTLAFLPSDTMHGFDRMGPVSGSLVFLPASLDLPWPETAIQTQIPDSRAQMELTQQIDQIARECAGDGAHKTIALECLTGLLAVWLARHLGDADNIRRGRAADLAAAYSALIDRDFGQNASVGRIAGRLGVTPTHLTRVCKETAGQGAHELLTNRRLFEARRLLIETDMAVKDIATRTGFASAAYFSRAFRAITGQSPRDFRAQAAQTRNAEHASAVGSRDTRLN